MAPQTRSHGNSSNPSNPSGGVTYRSTSAAPKQRLFPQRERSVKLKTYGRKHTVRKSLKQETLTQMAFVSSSTPEQEHLLKSDDEHEEQEEDDDDNENEKDDAEEVQPIAPKDTVKSKKRSRGSRRKTAGDELVKKEKSRDTKRRKTTGDVPSSIPSSSFHTQTLTQFMSTKAGNGNEDWQINDSQDDDAGFILETPKKTKDPVPSKTSERQSELRSSVPSLIESVTPRNRRTKAVIPSSTSPTTPMMMRYSPAPHKSPLVVKSTNLTGPSPMLKKASALSKDRVIPDSYSTAHSSPTTQAPGSIIKATPKKTRFELPEDKENITPGRTKPKSPKPLRKTPAREPLQEVPDSDDDVDGTGDVEDDEASTEDENAPAERKGDEIPSTDDPEEAETCYGVIGDETQAELLSSADEISRELEEIGSLEPSRSRSATPTPIPKKTHVLSKTQIETLSTHSPASVIEQTPSKRTQKKQPEESPTKEQTQIYTQGVESQRLPLEVIHALGPQNENSDIMVSLHPEPLRDIINGTKNHEFRVWEIPPTVTRVWIYSTRPFSELKYMCTLGPPKLPGEIQDNKGVGNVEFNQGKTAAKYAYEVLQVYELNDPVSLEEMKKRGWVKSAPQKYVWVPPAVVGELTANLKCALFGEDQENETEAALVPSSPNVTESQELKAQLQDDVEFSTQHHSDQVDEVILSSQSPRRSSGRRTQSTRKQGFVKPAPPRLEHGSSIQSLPAPASHRTRGAVRPSQATTVSSPAPSPERLPPQATPIPSDRPAPNLQSSSPAAFRRARDNSLRSSQFPTRSQMLPDSLINDEIQEPPPIIWDSADEQSD